MRLDSRLTLDRKVLNSRSMGQFTLLVVFPTTPRNGLPSSVEIGIGLTTVRCENKLFIYYHTLYREAASSTYG